MARRCPRSKALGPARLERHRLAVMREGWLTDCARPALRRPWRAVGSGARRHRGARSLRGLARGLYAKLMQPVVAERGPRRAIVYFGANAGPGAARPDYIAEILAAARSWPLAAEAIEALERIAAVGGSTRGRSP